MTTATLLRRSKAALGPRALTAFDSDLDIQPMTQQSDIRAARRLLGGHRRWLSSLGIDLGTAQPGHHPDYLDPARYYAVPAGLLLIARLRGEAVGMVGLRRLDDQPQAGEIRRMYVEPAARGRGVGSRLLRAVTAYAPWLEMDRLVLEVLPGPMDAAIAMYRSAGFEEGAPLNHTLVPGLLTLRLSLD